MEAIQYTCCRCGYLSSSKKLMRRHLYERKVVCPTKFDIELTDEIKEHIITYRIYHVPRHDVPVAPVAPVAPVRRIVTNNNRTVTNINRTVTNNNNNNNTTINIIADIDFLKKIQNYALHKNLIISSIDDMIGETFADNIKKLENDEFNSFELNHDDMFDNINTSSGINTSDNLEDFNIYHDEKTNKIYLHEGVWDEMDSLSGMTRLLENIQSYYWNAYELYILRKISKNNKLTVTNACMKLIEKYFSFILCFDLSPCCRNLNKNEIIYTTDDPLHDRPCDDYDLSERMCKLYQKLKENRKSSDIIATQEKVAGIIQGNSKKNIVKLNSSIVTIFGMDEAFKTSIMNQ